MKARWSFLGRDLRGHWKKAGMQALCDFRGVGFFQFFYAGDNLDHTEWEPRSLSNESRLDDKTKIALLALELALKIKEGTK